MSAQTEKRTTEQWLDVMKEVDEKKVRLALATLLAELDREAAIKFESADSNEQRGRHEFAKEIRWAAKDLRARMSTALDVMKLRKKV